MGEAHDLDRHGPFLSEALRELAFVDDDHVPTRREIHDLLSEMRSTAALDELEGRVYLVGTIHRHIDVPRPLQVEEWDAERLGWDAGCFTRGNSTEFSPLSDGRSDRLDEKACRRTRAQADGAPLGELGERGPRGRPFCIVQIRHEASRVQAFVRLWHAVYAPRPMRIHVGTSGYSYKEWKGKFYPEDLPAASMLRFYSERLSTVEINNTFYRMPSETMIEAWKTQAPAGFTFALKATQRITHQKRLKDADDLLRAFVRVSAGLGEKLGPLLFQLPPNMKKDAQRLEAFLAAVPSDVRATFEFRHASWFDDEVFEILRKHRAALCAAESEELKSPIVPTATWGYLRLRRTDYTDDSIAAWAETIRAQPWTDAHVFFKHDEGEATIFAAKLVGKLEGRAHG